LILKTLNRHLDKDHAPKIPDQEKIKKALLARENTQTTPEVNSE